MLHERRHRTEVNSLVILLTLFGIFSGELIPSSGYRFHSPRTNFSPKRNPIEADVDTYDFIVVGGGTAGCAIASRLSENGRHSVLLLEAGSIPDPRLDIPAMSPVVMHNSEYIVTHNTVPQQNAGLRNGGVVSYVRGRTLGGTSSVNFMYFNRGSPYDFDNWANITGDDSWSYRNMLKYFKKSEDYLVDETHSDQHGSGGPISVSLPSYAPGVDVWLAAGRSLGYPTMSPNGPQEVGFSQVEFSRRRGRRISSYTGYIKPYMYSRKNLKVILNAEASQIEFDGTKAVGVWYTINPTGKLMPQRKLVRAKNEIIVSSGVIGSPILLMKSGIGPRVELEKYGIAPVKILPVGENLQDHSFVRTDFVINNRSLVMDADRDLTPENWRKYQETGEGPYSSLFGFDGQAFLASSLQRRTGLKDWPDIQYMYISSNGITGSTVEYHKSDWEAIVSTGILLGRPKSRGTVKLNPTNVTGMPLVDFNYYSHPDDLEVVLDGWKTLLKLYETTPEYRRLGARLPSSPIPECRLLKFRSDEYGKCFIKQVAGASFHGTGTCAMGRGPSDKNAVVDSKLRVIGIDRLRVADASVMPQITNANPHAAIYGIAEKVSDMILQDWCSE